MLRDLAIAIHATGATVALVTGFIVLILGSPARRAWVFVVHGVSLTFALAALGVAIGVDWRHIGSGTRTVYLVLTGLAVLLLWRADCARRLRRGRSVPERRAFVGNVGFNVVVLLGGFVIVTADHFGATIWLVALLTAVALAGGLGMVAVIQHRQAPILDVSGTLTSRAGSIHE